MFWPRSRSIPRQLSSSPSVTPNELLEILLAKNNGYYILPLEPYDEVFPGIILGDSTTALCVHKLRQLGVTHVLNAAWGRNRNMGMVNTSEAYYRGHHIEFMGIEALDVSAFSLYPYFYAAADFIEKALSSPEGKILVHCGEGISRSSTLVIAYLMIKRGFTVSDAVRHVVKHRNILPNQGFLMQLCQLNDELAAQKMNPNAVPPSSPRPPISPIKPFEMPNITRRTASPSPIGSDRNSTSANSGSSRSPTPVSGFTPNFLSCPMPLSSSADNFFHQSPLTNSSTLGSRSSLSSSNKNYYAGAVTNQSWRNKPVNDYSCRKSPSPSPSVRPWRTARGHSVEPPVSRSSASSSQYQYQRSPTRTYRSNSNSSLNGGTYTTITTTPMNGYNYGTHFGGYRRPVSAMSR